MNISENNTNSNRQLAQTLSEQVVYTSKSIDSSDELEQKAQILIARCQQLLSKIQQKIDSINKLN